jgi:hypothetical protein
MHRLYVILAAVVPAAGILWLGWSAGTLLAVFVAEAMVECALMVLRIRAHERATADARHRNRGAYRRWGKWELPARYRRFILDYGINAAVSCVGFGFVIAIIVLATKQEYPALAPLMYPAWSQVAIGAAAAVAVALLELSSSLRHSARQDFRDLHDAAMHRLATVWGMTLLVMFSPLLIDTLGSPVAVSLGLIAVKAFADLHVRTREAEAVPDRPSSLQRRETQRLVCEPGEGEGDAKREHDGPEDASRGRV